MYYKLTIRIWDRELWKTLFFVFSCIRWGVSSWFYFLVEFLLESYLRELFSYFMVAVCYLLHSFYKPYYLSLLLTPISLISTGLFVGLWQTFSYLLVITRLLSSIRYYWVLFMVVYFALEAIVLERISLSYSLIIVGVAYRGRSPFWLVLATSWIP